MDLLNPDVDLLITQEQKADDILPRMSNCSFNDIEI